MVSQSYHDYADSCDLKESYLVYLKTYLCIRTMWYNLDTLLYES